MAGVKEEGIKTADEIPRAPLVSSTQDPLAQFITQCPVWVPKMAFVPPPKLMIIS